MRVIGGSATHTQNHDMGIQWESYTDQTGLWDTLIEAEAFELRVGQPRNSLVPEQYKRSIAWLTFVSSMVLVDDAPIWDLSRADCSWVPELATPVCPSSG